MTDLFREPWALWVVLGLAFLASFTILTMLLGTGARLRRERERASRITAVATPQDDSSRDVGRSRWLPTPVVRAAGRLAEAGGFGAVLDAQLEQANIPLRSAELVTIAAAAAFAGGVVGAVVMSNLVFILVFAGVGAAIPFVVVSARVRSRARRLHGQLPDMLTIMASSLRAGHSFTQALDSVAKEIPEPAAEELTRVVAEIRLGRPVDDALTAMAHRIKSADLRWALVAVNVHREVGGNLSEILDNVAETIRERDAVRRQIDVLTTEGRLSMYILTALPVLIAVYISIVNRPYLTVLFDTTVGLVMVAGAATFLLAGYLWMRRIVKIDV